jgi:predicted metal-dependent phosphoesterase TrpH
VIDLHLHSSASDGTDPPERIPELGAAAGCRAVALTDHDTLSGLGAAARRAAEIGIDLVRGCEVSCAFPGAATTHVLVYFVEGEEGPLQDELGRLRHDRVARNRRLAERLSELGVPATYEEAVALAAGEESLGRPHFAQLLVAKGLAESVPDAFDRWLGSGRPAYLPKARVAPADIAAAAAGSGALCVLAHPLALELAPADLDRAVGELAAAGFAGIEAHYASYGPEDRLALADLARHHDLVATGGSDYHGTIKAGLSVGTGRGDLRVPDEALDLLAARRP